MAIVAGNIIIADIKREPNILIPITTARAVRIDKSKVYLSTLIPVALLKTGSNVVA